MSHTVDVNVLGEEGFDCQNLTLPSTLSDYTDLWREIERLRKSDFQEWRAAMRLWTAADLFFLMLFCLSPGRDAWDTYRDRPFYWHPLHLWYARMVQFDSAGVVDVASRGFGKSTWKTFGRNIWTKLSDAQLTSCIFSHSREHAGKHLNRIKTELEKNELLKTVWSDRFYWDPQARPEGSPTWGVTKGLVIRRDGSKQESTFESHAFVDRLPAGCHFNELYFDDVETEATSGHDEVNEKIRRMFISAQDLTTEKPYVGIVGTYYDPMGLMKHLEDELGYPVRLMAGENLQSKPENPDDAGPMGGTPQFFTRESLFEKINRKGGLKNPSARRSYSMQIACDPLAGEAERLPTRQIEYYETAPAKIVQDLGCTVVVCVDPSQGKGDPTFCWVWALSPGREFYWVDGFRARVAPSERQRRVYQMALRWQSIGDLRQIRIEDYGQAEYADRQREYHRLKGGLDTVPIISCNWQGRNVESSKRDREYSRWEPALSSGRVHFPNRIMAPDEDGDNVNIVDIVVHHEMAQFPKPRTDDGLDAGALIWEPEDRVGAIPWPSEKGTTVDRQSRIEMLLGDQTEPGTWMGVGV